MKFARKREFDPTMSAKDDFFKQVNDCFDEVFSAIDLPRMTLMQVVDRTKQFDFKVDNRMVQSIIQSKLDYIFNDPTCSQCKSSLRFKYLREVSTKTTIGTITLKCPFFACEHCRTTHSPYLEVLNIRQGQYQHDVQKIAAKLAADGTFEDAAELLKDIYGFDISPDTVHHLANDLADQIQLTEIIPTREKVLEIVNRIADGQFRRPIFVFAADGAMVPIRTEALKTPNCWREAKGVRGYLIDGNKIVHLLSWHQVSTKHDFISYLTDIKDKNIIPTDKVRLCFIGDGADWIWETVNTVFPECRQVLDYYHCSQHLFDFAKDHFGDKSGKAAEWVEQTKARLFHNQATNVISGLKRFKCRTQAARISRDKLVGYLSNHQERIDYGKLRRGGFPIGSGAIESANKFISHVRLKRSGAWWKVDYANNILKLRCAKYNDKFDETFDQFEQSKKKETKVKMRRLRRIK